jgi:hypothetical protein
LVKNGGKQFYEYGFHVVNEWVGHAHKRVLFVFLFVFGVGEGCGVDFFFFPRLFPLKEIFLFCARKERVAHVI